MGITGTVSVERVLDGVGSFWTTGEISCFRAERKTAFRVVSRIVFPGLVGRAGIRLDPEIAGLLIS